MSDTLRSEIRDGLAVHSWNESIRAVKHTVANALRRLDRRVGITDTGYFNHSFVPDFTLTWPGSERTARDFYLRLGTSTEALADDLATMDASEPIFLDVGAIPELERSPLAELTQSRDTMVTDPAAMTALEPRRGARYADVLPSTMLKGGRGVVGEVEATSLQVSASSFFSGAETHAPETVIDATDVLFKYLSGAESTRVAGLGRIVWEATGGAPERFPLPGSMEGVRDDDSLRFLLESGPVGGASFWRSVGNSVSFERLVGLDLVATENLRSLVTANFDRLRAGVVVVKPVARESSRSESMERGVGPSQQSTDIAGASTASWSVSGGALLYHGADFTAYVATTRDRTPPTTRQFGHPQLRSIVDRVDGLPVESVTATTPDGKSVTVKSERLLDVLADETLVALVEGSSLAQSIGVRVDETKTLTCRFDDLSAPGRGRALFGLSQLLRASLPVLISLSEQDRAEMRAASAANDEVRPWRRPTRYAFASW